MSHKTEKKTRLTVIGDYESEENFKSDFINGDFTKTWRKLVLASKPHIRPVARKIHSSIINMRYALIMNGNKRV